MFVTRTSEPAIDEDPTRMSIQELERYYKRYPDQRPLRGWESRNDFEVKNGKRIMKVPPEERYCFGLPGKFYQTYEEWELDHFIIAFRIRRVPQFGTWDSLYQYRIWQYAVSRSAWSRNPVAQTAYDYLIKEAVSEQSETE